MSSVPYAPGAFESLKAVVYDFCESRAGEHTRTFLGGWNGSLVCDDYAGYKMGFSGGITEAGCLAHSRRKFFDLNVSNKSQIVGQALLYISQLYDVERAVKHLHADALNPSLFTSGALRLLRTTFAG